MYYFSDTTGQAASPSLPAEALKLNGTYLEEAVTGYRTLYVTGRELLAPEVTLTEVGARDGTLFRRRRYPERVITVGYQLIATTDAGFRTAFNQLCRLLDVEEAQLIFADEPDKYFIGTPSEVGEIDPGRNAVTGEFSFTCADPFKYSVQEYTATPSANGVFQIAYNGTMPGFPVLAADFTAAAAGSTADGCGYVAFLNNRGKIIQLGDPDEVDGVALDKSQTLVNQSFQTSNAWNTSVQAQWPKNVGTYLSTDITQTGTPGLALAATSEYFLTATSYGSGENWHGPSVTRTLPADAAGETGAANFTLTYRNKIAVGKNADDTAQRGCLQLFLLAADNTVVAGVNVRKAKSGADGSIRFYVNSAKAEDVDIDLSYYNQYFGNNNTAQGTKTAKTVKITKTGDTITFNAGGVQRSYQSSALADKAVTKVQFTFLQYGTKSPLTHCGLYSVKFVKHNCTEWNDIPNKFSAGDQLSADCGSGEILLNDLPAPDLGALGNDWEEFALLPGENQIATAYSDWVASAQKPSFQVQYREVFL